MFIVGLYLHSENTHYLPTEFTSASEFNAQYQSYVNVSSVIWLSEASFLENSLGSVHGTMFPEFLHVDKNLCPLFLIQNPWYAVFT